MDCARTVIGCGGARPGCGAIVSHAMSGLHFGCYSTWFGRLSEYGQEAIPYKPLERAPKPARPQNGEPAKELAEELAEELAMTRLDSRGLPLSTTSDRAAECYRDGVDLLLSAWPGAGEALEEAIAADPDFALAHAARARLHAIRDVPAKARARIATAEEAVA